VALILRCNDYQIRREAGKGGKMKNFLVFLCSILFILGTVGVCGAIPFHGVEFPDGAVSFADSVVSYNPSGSVSDTYDNPEEALGIPDYTEGSGVDFVSLGDLGELVLQFTDNSLTTSGDDSIDLWIFEIGAAIEPTDVFISTNGSDWISVGETSGATSGVDIDAYIGSGVVLWEQYSYVKIADLLPHQSGYPYEGADIDAVGAISSAPPVDPIPEPATMLLLGSGLIGLAGVGRKKFRK